MKTKKVSIICLSLVTLKIHGNLKIECSSQCRNISFLIEIHLEGKISMLLMHPPIIRVYHHPGVKAGALGKFLAKLGLNRLFVRESLRLGDS